MAGASEVRRDDERRGGVTPLTPDKELIEVFRFSTGGEERASTLIELELLGKGLLGGFVVGEEG